MVFLIVMFVMFMTVLLITGALLSPLFTEGDVDDVHDSSPISKEGYVDDVVHASCISSPFLQKAMFML
jgi:hypothetical protein